MIPNKIFSTERILILPIPNSKKEQIDEDLEEIVSIDNKTYTYEGNESVFELKLSNHCVIHKHCGMMSNDKETIIDLGSDVIILINLKDTILKSTCNNHATILTRHYLVQFTNCTIWIDNYRYENKMQTFEQVFVKQENNMTITTEKILSFKDLELTEVQNTKRIKEIPHHKYLNGTLWTFVIIVMIFPIIFYFLRRKQNININMRTQGHSGGPQSKRETPV